MYRNPFSYPPDEHWHRIKRWYRRLLEIESDESPEFTDYAIVVLLLCFSMRDWLINSGVEKPSVDGLFSSIELQVCRDVANGTKHFRIDHPSVDRHHEIIRTYVPPLPNGTSRNKLVLHAGGKSYGLREFCAECVRQIGDFMARLKPTKRTNEP
jgi:hypothetical protein